MMNFRAKKPKKGVHLMSTKAGKQPHSKLVPNVFYLVVVASSVVVINVVSLKTRLQA